MDRSIGKISLIENKAVKIMDDAAARKKDIAEQIRRETESFDRELEAETSARIDEVRTSMEAEMKKKLACQQSRADHMLEKLENHYKCQSKNYVEQLFKEMTGA